MVAEPCRIRSAVIVASLVRFEMPSWSAVDAPLADAFAERLRVAPDRARALVAARIRLQKCSAPPQRDDSGAQLYARWLREADATTRAQVLRALSVEDQARVVLVARSVAAFDAHQQTVTAWMLATGAHTFRRMPSVLEATALLGHVAGACACSDDAIVRWERALRVGGRHAACFCIAKELLSP